jgi:hypothetical protein
MTPKRGLRGKSYTGRKNGKKWKRWKISHLVTFSPSIFSKFFSKIAFLVLLI